MSDKPGSNRLRASKFGAQFRAFSRRVTVVPVDQNRWQIELDGAPTELVVICRRENQWEVHKASGEIVGRDCRSAAEAEGVAAHYLFHNGSPTDVP